jgi:hypothetical protein
MSTPTSEVAEPVYGTAAAIEETIEQFLDAGCKGFMVICNSAPSADALEQLAALPDGAPRD